MMTRLQQMSSDAKEVLNEPMHGQESLRLSRRFELPLPRPTISLDSDLREYRTGGSRCREEEIQNRGRRR